MKRRHTGRHVARLLLVGAMSAGLAACGGGGGDDDTTGDNPDIGGGSDIFDPSEDGDFDEDGIPNSADPDYLDGDQDGDGILNIGDPDFTESDADGDGIANGLDPDFTISSFMGDYDGDGVSDDPDDRDGDGIPNAEDPDFDAADLDGDGVQNTRDDDIDGDGLLNEDDDDIDGDGLLNEEDSDADGDGFDEPTEDDACGSADGTDADSSNNEWNDNCTVSRTNQFADSLYSAGIQRIVFCAAEGEAAAAADIDAFVDGEFGPGTEEAVIAYQAANTLGNDGVVGPQTWGSLQGELELAESAVLEGEGPFYDSYTVAGDRCGGAVLFFNEVSPAEGGLSVDRGGWTLARGASSTERVPFSTAAPFNVVD